MEKIQNKQFSDILLLDGFPMVVLEKGNVRTLHSLEGNWGYSKVQFCEGDGHQPMYRKMQEYIDSISGNQCLKKVLVLGAAGCGMPRYFIKCHDSDVVAIEISNEIIKVAKKYFYTDTYGDKLSLIEDDALHYVSVTEDTFDVVFVDLFNGSNVIEGVFDTTFLANVKRITNKEGIIIFNVLISDEKRLTFLMSNFDSYQSKFVEGPGHEKEVVFTKMSKL